MLYPRSNLEIGLCKFFLNVWKSLLFVSAKQISMFVFIPVKSFSSFLYAWFFMHSFLLFSSFPHSLPQVSALSASGFSTFHLSSVLFLMILVTCIWYMLCNLEISAYLFLPQICPSSHQGTDVRCGDKSRKVKKNKCIEIKITTANTQIKLKKWKALKFSLL